MTARVEAGEDWFRYLGRLGEAAIQVMDIEGSDFPGVGEATRMQAEHEIRRAAERMEMAVVLLESAGSEATALRVTK